MNFAKRLLMVAGAVALAGVFGALLVPKAAHGIVATLVQVVNTSAQPVPTLATDALSSFGVVGVCDFSGNALCVVGTLYTVPAGKIAVIESTSGRCLYNAGNIKEAFLQFPTINSGTYIFLERTHGNAGSGAVETWTHSVKGYAFGGSSGHAIIFQVDADSNEDGTCLIAIGGHLISQ